MRKTLIGMCLMAFLPVAAHAQTGKHVAIGGSIGLREFTDDHFSKKNPAFSALYRFSRDPSHHKEGWVWRLGGTLGYSHTDFDDDIGATEIKIGSVRTIPVVGGIERAYRHEHLKVGVSAFAGPSFNKFSIDNAARAAYEDQLGVPLENVTVKNSLAIRSGVGVWYDVSRRIGLHAGTYYMYNRPKATTTVGGVSTTETWKVDHFSFSTGLAVGIF